MAQQQVDVDKARREQFYYKVMPDGSLGKGRLHITGALGTFKGDLEGTGGQNPKNPTIANGQLTAASTLYLPGRRLAGTWQGLQARLGAALQNEPRYDALSSFRQRDDRFLAEIEQFRAFKKDEREGKTSLSFHNAKAILDYIRENSVKPTDNPRPGRPATARAASTKTADLWAGLSEVLHSDYKAAQANADDNIKDKVTYRDVTRVNLRGVGSGKASYKNHDRVMKYIVGLESPGNEAVNGGRGQWFTAPLPMDVLVKASPEKPVRWGGQNYTADFTLARGTDHGIYLGKMVSRSQVGVQNALRILGYPNDVINRAVQISAANGVVQSPPPKGSRKTAAKKGGKKGGKKGARKSRAKPVSPGPPPLPGATGAPSLQPLAAATSPVAAALPQLGAGTLAPLNPPSGLPALGQLPSAGGLTTVSGSVLPGLPTVPGSPR